MRPFTEAEKQKLRLLTNYSISMTYLEPTETAIDKSIIDATIPVREYFIENEYHDYDTQGQGTDHKVLRTAFMITDEKIVNTKVSMYRPQTKQGDPRIWFYGLKDYVKPNEIIALIIYDDDLYVFNLTQLDIRKLLINGENNPFAEFIHAVSEQVNLVANELLSRMRDLAKQPIPTVVKGDTGIGRTLETHLGISMNSKKAPDYKGIELKSFRVSRDGQSRTNRKTLFAQVPDWSISKFKSSAQILDTFGYDGDNDDFRLYCTVSTKTTNSQGLSLRVDSDYVFLFEQSDQDEIGDFATWRISKLKQRLAQKHNETFWISADSFIENGQEYFLYKLAKHTRKPLVDRFGPLLESGDITLDHLIKRKSGKGVREKGPLFKIYTNSMSLLFPDEIVYELR